MKQQISNPTPNEGKHFSKERVLKRMRERRAARRSSQPKGTDKLINFVLLIFTLAAVALVLAVFIYFGF